MCIRTVHARRHQLPGTRTANEDGQRSESAQPREGIRGQRAASRRETHADTGTAAAWTRSREEHAERRAQAGPETSKTALEMVWQHPPGRPREITHQRRPAKETQSRVCQPERTPAGQGRREVAVQGRSGRSVALDQRRSSRQARGVLSSGRGRHRANRTRTLSSMCLRRRRHRAGAQEAHPAPWPLEP